MIRVTSRLVYTDRSELASILIRDKDVVKAASLCVLACEKSCRAASKGSGGVHGFLKFLIENKQIISSLISNYTLLADY